MIDVGVDDVRRSFPPQDRQAGVERHPAHGVDRLVRMGAGVGSGDDLRQLQQALAAVAGQRGRFEAWFTHMFVLSDLTGYSAPSGEGFILASGPDGKARVLARIGVPA
mgnify:CR=1 FL=1